MAFRMNLASRTMPCLKRQLTMPKGLWMLVKRHHCRRCAGTWIYPIGLKQEGSCDAMRGHNAGPNSRPFTAAVSCLPPLRFTDPRLLLPSRGIMGLFGPSQPTEWVRALSEAEKLVGYSTSFMSLRCLLSDELANVALHMRKLVGTRHPLLKTAKSFLTDGKHSLQMRGLIVLLVSKAASAAAHRPPQNKMAAVSGGIYPSQRVLAEISEMIHTAFLVHRGVVNLLNLDPSLGPVQVMEFGNKMAVLSGDFLLASACKALAGLRNTTVVELISKAIAHLTEAAFMNFGNSESTPALTTGPKLNFSDWERYVYLSSGTLIGRSCRGALELTNHSASFTESAYHFGTNLAWAQQLHSELRPFVTNSATRGRQEVNLRSAPVLLYLESSLNGGQGSEIKNLSQTQNIKKLTCAICSSPALEKARSLCRGYADNALTALHPFPPSDAKTALKNMVCAVRT